VAALIWLMIIPMLAKIDFAALGQVREHWRDIGVTLFVNWAVKPFSMALLAGSSSAGCSDPTCRRSRSTATSPASSCSPPPPAPRWSSPGATCPREPHFTLSQVALNDTIMIFAFAPIVGLLLGLSAITVPWQTLLITVGLYIVVPVILAQIVRRATLARGGPIALRREEGEVHAGPIPGRTERVRTPPGHCRIPEPPTGPSQARRGMARCRRGKNAGVAAA
jgi:ACR3 family arsenite transporter